jgi:predicted nucleic acid-binding Zn ribbon protein
MIKYELCEDCRLTFVPTSWPKVHGKRLCSNCAPKEHARVKNKRTALTHFRRMVRGVQA